MENVYARRREELMRRLPPRAVAIIHGTPVARRNSDVEHKYRASSDLLYLTGFHEPESYAVIAPARDTKFVMFVRPRDPERETWTGRRLGVQGAIETLGAGRAHPVAELAAQLVELLDGADEVHYLPGDEPEIDRQVMAAVQALKQGERRGRRADAWLIVNLRATLHEMRLIKDADGLEKLRRAVEITAEAHVAAMRAARPGVHEYEIEALLDYTFRRRGASGPGYGTIVGGGDNATILHYVENEAPLGAGELLLVDAGAEYQGYTADVTRTYPISGRFSEAQRRVYDLVLDTEKRCIEMVRPGATIDEIHQRAVHLLTSGMVRLGWLEGEVDKLIEKEAFRKFYMHRTSHWLGLDVHDAGMYYPGTGAGPHKARPLEPGMVLTVEPGLYVGMSAEGGTAAHYRGIGVRIEDDVLVTEGGHEVLTRAIPKDPEELERITGIA